MNKQFWALALGAAALTGCADNSAITYNQSQMQRAQTVQLGTVVSVQPVKVKGDSNALLTLGGAALGGLAGSNIGGGSRGSAAGAVVGAMAGGYGAQAAQKNLGGKNALEITVKLDSGQTISIVQGADTPIVNGQRVRVLTGAGADRVVPL